MPAERGDRIDRQDLIDFITTEVFDKLYPIGAIYISLNSTNPSTIFGGTWVAIEGKFLIGANSTYTAASTGGAASQSYTPAGTVGNTTLSLDQIPSHNHGLNGHTHSLNGHSHSIPNHTHTYWFGSAVAAGNAARAVSGEYGAQGTCATSGWSGTTGGNSGNTGGNSGNTTNQGGSKAHNHSFTGTQATIDTIPPYLAVYMWQRTA